MNESLNSVEEVYVEYDIQAERNKGTKELIECSLPSNNAKRYME